MCSQLLHRKNGGLFLFVAVLAVSKWRSSSDVLLTTWEDHLEDHETNIKLLHICKHQHLH